MYNVDDVVIFNSLGVCRVSEIVKDQTGGDIEEFYVLEPIYDQCSTSVFVPVKNGESNAKIRSVATVDEINNVIKTAAEENFIWIDDENLRSEKYKEIIENGDKTELVNLIKTLYFLKKHQKEKGKKFYINDGNFLRKAEKQICSEFAFVLNIEPKDVIDFIIKQMQKGGMRC